MFFLRNIALVHLSTIFPFVLNVTGLTTANAEEYVLQNPTFLIGASHTRSTARFGVRERCEDNIYMDLTRTSYEVAVQLYCLNSCWIHLWKLLMKFAFHKRSDVLEASVIFRVDSLDIHSSLNSKYNSWYPKKVSNFVLNKSALPSDATSNTTRAYLHATLLTPNLHNSSTPPWRFRHTITPHPQLQVPGSVCVSGHSSPSSSPILNFRVFQRPWSYAS